MILLVCDFSEKTESKIQWRERVQRLTLITVSELVKFLRDENARDICIMMIQSPPRTGVCELPSHLCWDWDTVCWQDG